MGLDGSTSDSEGNAPSSWNSAAGYGALAASLPGGAVFVLDREHRYLLAEGPALQAAGLAPSDFAGRSVRDVVGDALAGEYEPRLRRAAAGEPFVHEHRAHGRRYVSHGSPIDDGAGGVSAVLVVSYDVTDQRRAEEALRLSEQRYRALAMATQDVAYGVSADWSVMLPLDGRGLVASTQEPIRGWFEMNIPPDERERVWAAISKAIETRSLFELEHRVSRPDGTIGWTFSRAAPILDDEGNVVEWFGAARDITERKGAEEEAKRLNDSLEETVRERTAELLAANEQLQGFTYSVAHDLRQQIRGINSNAALLVEDAQDRLDEESLERLARLRQAAKRLGTIVDDLLAFARHGRKEPVVADVDLSAVASTVVEAIREEGRYSSVPEVTIEPGLVARADPSLIAIVLENLLDNALKYSARSPSPEVRFGAEGDAFYVADNGAGFDMEHAARLFEPFERLHSAEEFPGTGIGLANVRRIVRKHGGDAWAEGEPGRGARFWFSLPAP